MSVCIYKYIVDHSRSVEHVMTSHRKISTKVIAPLSMNLYHDGKGRIVTKISVGYFQFFSIVVQVVGYVEREVRLQRKWSEEQWNTILTLPI